MALTKTQKWMIGGASAIGAFGFGDWLWRKRQAQPPASTPPTGTSGSTPLTQGSGGTAAASAPGRIIGIMVQVSGTSAVISWVPPQGVTSQTTYTVRHTDASGNPVSTSMGTAAAVLPGLTKPTVTLSGLQTGAVLHFQVQACNGAACGPWSPVAMFSIAALPTCPTQVLKTIFASGGTTMAQALQQAQQAMATYQASGAFKAGCLAIVSFARSTRIDAPGYAVVGGNVAAAMRAAGLVTSGTPTPINPGPLPPAQTTCPNNVIAGGFATQAEAQTAATSLQARFNYVCPARAAYGSVDGVHNLWYVVAGTPPTSRFQPAAA